MADASYIFETHFEEFQSTLKSTSIDDHHKNISANYLCRDETQMVYDFDKIIKTKYHDRQPASFDAILIENQNIYCIEFKNSKYSDIHTSEIHQKIIDGKSILDDILSNYNVPKRNYKFICCIVYKDHPPKWRRGITKNILQFDLEKFKGIYYDEVYTNDISYFTKEYKKHFTRNLTC